MIEGVLIRAQFQLGQRIKKSNRIIHSELCTPIVSEKPRENIVLRFLSNHTCHNIVRMIVKRKKKTHCHNSRIKLHSFSLVHFIVYLIATQGNEKNQQKLLLKPIIQVQ
jgi:hypothetical protein